MLTALRDWRKSRQETTEKTRDEVFVVIVTTLADGGELEPEIVEEYISPETQIRLHCPRNADHPGVRIISTTDGVASCVCNSCGAEFKQEAPTNPVDDGKFTVEEIEAAVQLLKQRRAWAAQIQEKPKHEKTRDRLEAKVKAAEQAVVDAIQARDQLKDEIGGELAVARRQVQLAEEAEGHLLRTGKMTSEESDLRKRRGEIASEVTRLKREAWGSLGTPERGTIAEDFIRHDTEIARLQSSDLPHEQARLQKLKSAKERARKQRDSLREKHDDLEAELITVEHRLAELEKEKLNP